MKARNFLVLVLTVILAISLVACGDSGDNGADTVGVQGSPDGTGAVEQTGTNTDDGDDTVAEAVAVSVFLGENDIEKYSVVFSSEDTVGTNIADYLLEKVKGITGKEIVTSDSAEGLEYAIVIGVNSLSESELGDNEFVIKFVGNNLYISYSEGATAFQAVSTVLDDALFASHNRVDDTYTLASDFEFSGKCGDYVIGDNEFNPFE